MKSLECCTVQLTAAVATLAVGQICRPMGRGHGESSIYLYLIIAIFYFRNIILLHIVRVLLNTCSKESLTSNSEDCVKSL